MRKLFVLVCLVGLFSLLHFGCGNSPTKETTKDTEGPIFRLDSMFAGGHVLHNGDSIITDSVYLKGHINDPSGVDVITATVGGIRSMNVSFNDSTWNAKVYVRSGLSSINFEATDNENNKSSLSATLYYKTDYFPVNDSSYWKFSGSVSADTVSVKTDSTVIGFSRKSYGMNFSNGIVGSTKLWVYPKNNACLVDTALESVIDSKDTLFIKEYSPASIGYSGKTIRFIGDSTISNITYRNCANVRLKAGTSISGITGFVLVPYKGIVGVEANAKGYPLSAYRN